MPDSAVAFALPAAASPACSSASASAFTAHSAPLHHSLAVAPPARVALLHAAPLRRSESSRRCAAPVSTPVMRSKSVPPITDFCTVTDASDVLPYHRATLDALTPVASSQQYVQLTVDVSESGLHLQHSAPGQSMHLARLDSDNRATVLATIASPPQAGPLLHFLIARSADAARLTEMKPGQQLAVSQVVPSTYDYISAPNAQRDMHIFVDSPQAFAAVRSLIEWPKFRAATGNGANRSTYLTVYYSLPLASGIPYGADFSKWSVFGVNIVPIAGRSILEFLSVRKIRGATHDFAVAAVASDTVFEYLRNALILHGFAPSAVSKFTADDVLDAAAMRAEDGDEESGFDGDDGRSAVEEDVWQSWVRVREAMHRQFERDWSRRSKTYEDAARAEKEKQQAWAGWMARNREQWTRVQWDDQSWGRYWQTWRTSRESWTNGADSSSWAGAADGRDGGGYKRKWSQQNSQEYWDWVSDGAQARSRGGQHSRGGRGTSNSTGWADFNGGTGYQGGGYRYEHQDVGGGDSGGGGGGGGGGGYGRQYAKASSGGRHSSANSWNQRKNYTGWDGSRRSSGRQGGGRQWDKVPTISVDLYAVLGISSTSSRSEIKKAYRKKAMENHPDQNPNSKDAPTKMKQIIVAWTVLKDEGRRKKYDLQGLGAV